MDFPRSALIPECPKGDITPGSKTSCPNEAGEGFLQPRSLVAGEITLWNSSTRQQLGPPLTGYNPSPIAPLVFSPDGKALSSRNMVETIILWDLASRRPLDPPIKAWGEDPVFSPDGALMALGSDHGEISFWEVGLPVSLYVHL